MQQFITIRNEDTEDFVAKYDGEYLTIPAGGQRTFAWDVMVCWMGDPNLFNTEVENIRDEAYKNICTFHNARGLTGNEPDLLPKLAAYDEDGNRIVTIMDDPDGLSYEFGDAAGETGLDVAALQRQIEAQQAQLDQMMARMADTPEAQRPETEGRSAGTEGTKTAEIQAERDREDGVEDLNHEVDTSDESTTATTGADGGNIETFSIPADEPTQTPVGKTNAPGQSPATEARTAKRSTGRRTTPSTGRSAGTAGKRRSEMADD